jgi:hypothetical protein
MGLTTEKTVATPSDTQTKAHERLDLPRTLMGGTAAMRAAGEKYLPREKAESIEAYNARVKRTTLFNAFTKTVEDMTGKVFAKPIVLKDDVPKQIVDYAEDIDRGGRHINVFARDVFFDGMQAGISYILVDMPEGTEQPTGRPATVAEEKSAGLRPYMVHITVEQILGWKSEVKAGVETLTQLRISEMVSEPDGEFHEKQIEQVRVLEPGKWSTYRKDSNSKWIPYKNGTNSLDKITLAPVYIKRTAFMQGVPPLEKLAELNVAHWQSSSDQRNILHVARVPILFGSGFPETAEIVVGASQMVRSSDSNAKLAFVEHSGGAIGAGRDDLKDLEFQMQAMGLQLLVAQPGGKTATGEMRDDSKENSPLAMAARALGDGLEMALGFMAEYERAGTDGGGSVEVNTDFGLSAASMAAIPSILSAYTSGLISRETAWQLLQRHGFLADDFDPDAEAARVQDEEAAKISQIPAA